jgi:hypothetical protein
VPNRRVRVNCDHGIRQDMGAIAGPRWNGTTPIYSLIDGERWEVGDRHVDRRRPAPFEGDVIAVGSRVCVPEASSLKHSGQLPLGELVCAETGPTVPVSSVKATRMPSRSDLPFQKRSVTCFTVFSFSVVVESVNHHLTASALTPPKQACLSSCQDELAAVPSS